LQERKGSFPRESFPELVLKKTEAGEAPGPGASLRRSEDCQGRKKKRLAKSHTCPAKKTPGASGQRKSHLSHPRLIKIERIKRWKSEEKRTGVAGR